MAHKHFNIKPLCSQRHTVHTRRLSQAKTTTSMPIKYKQPTCLGQLTSLVYVVKGREEMKQE